MRKKVMKDNELYKSLLFAMENNYAFLFYRNKKEYIGKIIEIIKEDSGHYSLTMLSCSTDIENIDLYEELIFDVSTDDIAWQGCEY